ncbi:TolC family protein [Namhaeicola litoreus]|uniref:TolC family protein n=1 Tax=Namhaeicola litoreus TaxID=1052145 RepID=A0ABW3Y2R4_9FLAO
MKRFLILVGLLIFNVGFAQEMETLIEIALENSPEIEKFELQHEIVKEKVNEVNNIPNTEVGFGYFISEPETRTGAQRYKVSVKQMLPWFGSITARENYVGSLADAQYEDLIIAKRKLIASVSQSYYNLNALKAQKAVLIENMELLNTFENLALTYVEVGKSSAVDVLKLQMRQNELKQLHSILEFNYLAEQTNLNKLLNRDKDTPIEISDNLIIPESSEVSSQKNIELHPEILKFDKLYQSVVQSELLNQKEKNPMIGFGIDYINVEERTDMDFSDNGKDILMPMVALTIPIFNKKYKSQTRQNELQQQEIIAQKQERTNTLEAALDKAINDRYSAIISFETQQKNLIQAKNAEEILIKNYETGTIDFKDVLDIQELQIKFQLAQIDAVKSYYVQSSIINYLSL